MKIFVYLPFLWLVSCSPTTLEDYRIEGESETRKFASELREIETKEDLQRSLPKIKKRFIKIADLLIKICNGQRKIPQKERIGEPSLASDELFVEMARLYEIPGGRELIETCQAEAIRKIDRAKSARH